MENNIEDIQNQNILKQVIDESTRMALKYDQVSRAYLQCVADIKEMKINMNNQLGFFADRIDKLEREQQKPKSEPEPKSESDSST